uniref:Candidate secreted effector protein n=1 Tax=Rhabditophanes sp. KR3021 TaxID=114890 RepID=A0AC35U6R3_9BILA
MNYFHFSNLLFCVVLCTIYRTKIVLCKPGLNHGLEYGREGGFESGTHPALQRGLQPFDPYYHTFQPTPNIRFRPVKLTKAQRRKEKDEIAATKVETIITLPFEKIIRENETFSNYKTEVVDLEFNVCIEYRYLLSGNRTRLNVFTCNIEYGGICDSVHHKNTKGKELCATTRSWSRKTAPFSFHFFLERRPRTFRNLHQYNRQYTRLRRHPELMVKEVGQVRVSGFMPCEKTCLDSPSTSEIGISLLSPWE